MTLYKLPRQYSADFKNPLKKPIGNVDIDWSNPDLPDFGCLFLEGAGSESVIFSNNKDYAAGSVGNSVSIDTADWRPTGIASETGGDVTIPTRWNNGGSITLVVQLDPESPQDTFSRVFENANGTLGLDSNASNHFSIGYRVDFHTGTFTVSTNIWDGAQHVISLEWPKNTEAGPYCIRINGVIEDTDSPGTQGSIDIDGSLTLGNRPSGARSSGLIIKAFYMAERAIPRLGKDPFKFLKPKTPPVYFTPVSSSGITVTGTAVPTQTEADIVTGGKTIILTLTGDTFVTGTSSEDGIAGGSDSDIAASGTNWDSLIKTALDNTDVALSVGDTVATITLPAFGTYDIPSTETITWTIPAASLTTGTSDIIATPTHTVTPSAAGGILSPYYFTNLLAS